MNSNAKLIAAFGALVLVTIVGVVFLQVSNNRVSYNSAGSESPVDNGPVNFGATPTTPSLPPATGDIDDVAGALEAEVLGEEITMASEANDVSEITSDAQEISDFGQSYQNNDF